MMDADMIKHEDVGHFINSCIDKIEANMHIDLNRLMKRLGIDHG